MQEKMNRPSWEHYFAALADMASTRSTCSRAHVGCVIVKDKRILAMGYNGAPAGSDHCDHSDDRLSTGFDHPLGDREWVGYDMQNGHCITAVHAEMNAIADCARRGVPCDGATAYITKAPCDNCKKLLVGAGIIEIASP